ncbi:cilia- and flagella-associated protein 97-like [Fopius arisanus]|uniref:Cilia- and flagella-associated protein 97-like n=1 Tax=Fopius arisanus TaxID=64838 RepID=A0A9R1TVI0_9HYME|nr:PREDICTED: cilia- and flagella-associated protein 97-like [Fopius arisanus]XP_011297974.1 PREDICTED: cilia- and flagella-associated protein 97-like [Fopius arisanus]
MSDKEECSEKTEEDGDGERYSYSEDSLSSGDLTDDSEVTSVTGRSSLSEESFPPSKESPEVVENSNYQKRSYSSSSGRPSPTGVNCARRKNMSFTNMEMMKIERENQCLLRKIMAQQRQKKSGRFSSGVAPRLASSAINRRRMQRRIDEDNITILRKIQEVKSSSLSGKRSGVCESTSY